MLSNDFNNESSQPSVHPVNLVLGLMLITIGLCLAGVVVWQIYLLLTAPEDMALIGKLADEYLQNREGISDEILRVYVPELIMYGVPILLLSMLINLINIFFTNASRLLLGDWDRARQEIMAKLTDIKEKLP